MAAFRTVAVVVALLGLVVRQAHGMILYAYYDDLTVECMDVITDIYGDFDWPGYGYPGYYNAVCTNPNCLIGIYASMYRYCDNTSIKHGLADLSSDCSDYGEVDLVLPEDLADNLTAAAIALLPVYSESAVNETMNQTMPFIIDEDWFEINYRSEHAFDVNHRRHVQYGFSQYGFWGAILVIGMVQNFIRHVVDSRRGYIYVDAEGNGRVSTKTPLLFVPIVKLYALFNKYMVTPSLLPPYHRQRVLGCTIPTRLESFVVYSYWIVSIVLSAINFSAFKGNTYYGDKSEQLSFYVAQRAGVLAYCNFPLIWMFSGRNNVFIWLTGWNFGTFNIFHRHIARIATLEGIVHSVSYTVEYFASGDGDSYRDDMLHSEWFYMGAMATIIMSFIIILSFSFFRTYIYDSFLIMHIVGSVLLLVFLWYHTGIYNYAEWNYPFLYPPVALWSIDRLVRLIRQVYCNIHVSLSRDKTLHHTKATVTYDATGNILLFDIVAATTHMFVGPGQHYYLYQPLRFFGWQNHPFTLADWRQDGPDGDLHLHFWVRPYDGWTKDIRKQCVKKGAGGPTATLSTAMLIEGPYGKCEPIHTFDEVLLLAGGTGIAAVLPYLKDYLRRLQSTPVANADSFRRVHTRTRHITLVWVDRSEAHIRHTVATAMASMLGREDISILLYLTGTPDVTNTSSASSSNDEPLMISMPEDPEKSAITSPTASKPGSDREGSSAHSLPINVGRPDVLSVVSKAAAVVHGSETRLAVMVCGPSSLSDMTRQAVSSNMERSRDNIELFEEAFAW